MYKIEKNEVYDSLDPYKSKSLDLFFGRRIPYWKKVLVDQNSYDLNTKSAINSREWRVVVDLLILAKETLDEERS